MVAYQRDARASGGPPVRPPPPTPPFPHPPPLGPGPRLERAAERSSPPRLHLDECHEVPLARDQVDLRVADAEPVRHDVPTARQEVLDRLLLAGEATLVAVGGPPRRGWAATRPPTRSASAPPRGRPTNFSS